MSFILRNSKIQIQDSSGNIFQVGSNGTIESFTDLASGDSSQKQPLSGSRITGIGKQVRYIASESISLGQPLVKHITPEGDVFALIATTSSLQSNLLGISLNTASIGESVDILQKGITTVNYEKVTELKLNSSTNGNTTNLQRGESIIFTDSGGTGSIPGVSEQYNHTFYAGNNNYVKVSFDEFEFNHTQFRMKDRLGVEKLQIHGAGSFVNVNFDWMQASNNSSPYYSRDFDPGTGPVGFERWDGPNASPGYIFPKDINRANSLGGFGSSHTFKNQLIDTEAQYIRFNFLSDNNPIQDKDGWVFRIQADITASVGNTLYIGTQKGFLSETATPSTTPSIGTVLAPNADFSSVLASINF